MFLDPWYKSAPTGFWDMREAGYDGSGMTSELIITSQQVVTEANGGHKGWGP